MKNENNNLFTTLTDIGHTLSTASVTLRKATEPYLEAARSVESYLKSVDIQGIFERMSEGIASVAEGIERFEELFAEAGYPPNRSLSIDNMMTLMEMYNEEGMNKVLSHMDQILIDFYGEEALQESLEEILDFNLECLKGREVLIRQVFEAYINRQYALTVPAIITQFEGIIVSAYGVKGKVYGSTLETMLNNLFGDSRSGENSRALKYYKDHITVNFVHGSEPSSIISRHGIAHGGILPKEFAKEELSLKLILTLEYIVHRIDSLRQEDIDSVQEQIETNRKKN